MAFVHGSKHDGSPITCVCNSKPVGIYAYNKWGRKMKLRGIVGFMNGLSKETSQWFAPASGAAIAIPFILVAEWMTRNEQITEFSAHVIIVIGIALGTTWGAAFRK